MTDTKVDIHKAAGIIIRNRKLLVERSRDKEFFIAPGGCIEKGETPEQALVRELKEEFAINVVASNFEPFDKFYADAAGQEHLRIRMDVFVVKKWRGKPKPSSEVEELAWITSVIPKGMQVGSIFEHQVIPRLKVQNLID